MFCVFINSCYECYSDVCWQEIERKKFLMLSPEQQKLKREECMKWVPVSCYTYSEPTSKELKKNGMHPFFKQPVPSKSELLII